MSTNEAPSPANIPRCTLSCLQQLAQFFLSEFLGTGFLCLAFVLLRTENGCSATTGLVVALLFSVVAWVTGPVSGAQVNPVVSFVMTITRRISIIHMLVCWAAQLLGAIAGALIGKAIGPSTTSSNPSAGMTLPSSEVTTGQAVAIEFIATTILLLSILAAVDEFRAIPWGRNCLVAFVFAFGITIGLLAAVFGPYTGASMNTARSLGPAIANGNFNQQWIYVVGPFAGGLLATILHEFFLTSGVSIPRIRACFTKRNFDRSKDYTTSSFDATGEP